VTPLLVAAAALVILAGGPARAASPPAVNEETVHEIASELRCVVCQSLSVADSPSETASQMRGIIRERLAAGETPAQVRDYFVDKYGPWILLSPPRRGFDLLVWVAPFLVLGIGLVMVALVVRRWRRAPSRVSPPALDPAVRERIRREMEELDR
jgi:cytochrome c-type biogenesis protein CcmH